MGEKIQICFCKIIEASERLLKAAWIRFGIRNHLSVWMRDDDVMSKQDCGVSWFKRKE